MKLITWNVNGLRSVQRKNFRDWFENEKADIVCLQEIKISEDALKEDETLYHPARYHSVWNFAEKPGYSGLALYSKKEPEAVRRGLGIEKFDREGRWLEADFGPKTIINSYWPNSQRDHARLPFKLEFCAAAEKRLQALRKKGREVIICGDFNIAHKEIDLKNPKTNVKNAGFLPEERAWMTHFLENLEWVDSFRKFEQGGNHYTWWSYRPGVRERNVGWRLDYFLVNKEASDRLKAVSHLPEVMGSDHCPVRLTLKK
ncbi:MAG: exodeoxyribonuclease III [Bdellovibrio sp. ArHS]|uniref:exodeoxyribonuclease III n=1 Tax=Bdellovibrio sp. ArHS TaxID=1569284 RepID=UPI0005827A7E|nr:exodeoxyribonuclease III [Bdellovibrio sp. ArHS]KHD87768.1 MAG: exodeoxyribonuclease III [Bdellovibrio sp. ArHS]